ncbi:DUF4126 domain-containing protein [Moheibacter sediminis]|uniref:DUF4126 domain-containing protein n=1 Tax=Moheibacter sediminis TaxID=1434700 RepID=A0A1W2CF55_9FLAO|nr:DUF4126 domain-containing protein [Moheibacter sediminis]SMC83789.1 protein of unknown function [Moheibacter sediminis]
MDIFDSNTIMSFFLGIGLAASAGFRVFLPLFVLSIGAHFGQDLLELNEAWQWVGSWPAMIALGVATIVEIIAYYIPIIDNFLDTIAIPLAAVAGTVLMGSTLLDMSEVTTWALAIIAGGGTAAAVSGTTAAARAVSTSTTGGTGNFVVNTGETAAASVLSLTSLIWAPIAFIFVLIVLFGIYRLWKWTKKQRIFSGQQ